ncbi:hypothetical protein QA584_22625 [Anaerocolumna sp. AGMB13025]|uniref:hypothetical protein n=1 Tax=Anaerocolumna sp. AGMB13025 TaxID=3039116 RepID=UPI00241EAA7C|nr:hypothetical protein [Anaerocolumna sp. AGMB13025]WFR56381.1 hypothetical protein QA584_22625 [Anaerocolumna sp. AGMB13025]
MASSFITVNGKSFPSPDIGLNFEVATLVNGGKNANGEFVGQKIGRDQYKIDNLQWFYLDAATWSKILKEFDKFAVSVRFPDMVNNTWITLLMYPGNRTAVPSGEINKSTGLPIAYKNCKVNIIDCGVV